jgi:hypothetical protein
MTPWSVDVGPLTKCKMFEQHVCAYLCTFLHVIEMESENYEIRVLLRFFWKKGAKAAAAAREICQVEGPGTVSTRAAQRWFRLSQFGLQQKYCEIGDSSKIGLKSEEK